MTYLSHYSFLFTALAAGQTDKSYRFIIEFLKRFIHFSLHAKGALSFSLRASCVHPNSNT
ncbi:hypothetical protein PTET_b0539 [Pseudoalteromonas tetraodonis]|nr:hypothetical protein PTET_b0539 [Pseudoalteromonas tetraodonis]